MLTEVKRTNMIRNDKICYERNVEQRTLQAIAEKYSLTRERVRQIVDKANKAEKVKANLPINPVLMKDIEWSVRIYKARVLHEWAEVPIVDFIKACKEKNLLEKIPNLGNKSSAEILDKLAKFMR